MVALDTGFFVAMMRGSKKAISLWREFKKEKIRPIISTLVVGELLYIFYREGKSKEAKEIVERMAGVGEVENVSVNVVTEGAGIKHSLGIPYVDALIGATALINGCKKLYTSDRKHMKRLEGKGITVFVID